MDLFELQAKLKLDDSSFTKGIDEADKAGQKLKNGLSAASVAIGNLAADMIRKGISGINNVVKSAVDGYANYQQLIGGVETLFKTSASTVANYAKESYKTTGLSANDYMETVTSFSASLLQGLKGNTVQAAEIANMAVTDMADNANKMGTDISSIQAAYQGFAKQNYTMLDNLKLGYGGTKTEMVRLVNESGILDHKIKDLDGITFDQLIEAIHAIQEQMGITGTTAEEANQTISGSAASMKSAWQDMLTAVTGEGTADFEKYGYSLDEATTKFKESFETYMNNLIPAVQTTLNNAPALINTLAEAITSIPPKALSQATRSMVGVMTGAVEGARKIVDWIIDSLVMTVSDMSANPVQVQNLGDSIGTFVGNTIRRLFIEGEALELVPKLINIGGEFAGSVVAGFVAGLTGMDEGLYGKFRDIDREVSETIREANRSATEAQGILDYMQGLVTQYGSAATETDEWSRALDRLEQVLPGARQEIEKANGPLSDTVGNLQQEVELLRQRGIELAKEKALASKREAYYGAVADYETARYDYETEASIRNTAAEELIKIIRKYDPTAGQYTDEQFKGLTGDQLLASAQAAIDTFSGMLPDSAEFQEAWDNASGFGIALEESEGKMKTLESEMESLKKQMDDAETQLAITEAALDGGADSVNGLTSAAGNAANALNNIKGVRIPVGITAGLPEGAVAGKTPGIFYTPNATGKDYIPFNGYRAELHRGEAILTAAENRERLNGGMDYEALGSMVGDSIERAFSKVGIYMSGNRVADLTTRRMRGNINEETNARQRAMGG